MSGFDSKFGRTERLVGRESRPQDAADQQEKRSLEPSRLGRTPYRLLVNAVRNFVGGDARVERVGSSLAPEFVINGRFYCQPLTGVQRYAREITDALDALLEGQKGKAQLLAPRQADLPSLSSIETRNVSLTSGYLWEQVELPARSRKPILSLCNLGPAAATSQIVCIHDTNVFREPLSYSFAFRSVYKTLLPQLARRVARVVTVSHASRADLATFLPINARDVAVIPNGHEHALRWRPENSTVAARLVDQRPFVLLIGSRARHKNTEIVLRHAEALAALGIALVVAGDSAPIFSDVSANFPSTVRWLGRVTDDDLAWLYSHALCLAFPSLAEGFGLPLVEAMALGCPVVTSDRGSMREVCGDAALLASPVEPEAWLRHFVSLAGSAQLHRELSERGRRRVRRYSWTRAAQLYLQLLRGIA